MKEAVKTDLKVLPTDSDWIVWFGHSSYLFCLNGLHFLVDPILQPEWPSSMMLKSFPGTDIYRPNDLPKMTFETHKKRRFPTEGTPLQQIEHRVNPINLDFNGHVNNRTYLSIAMQSADEAFMDAHAIRCPTIHWLKDTFLGDTLTCRLILLSNETDEAVYHYLHTIARNDCETAAQVYSE